MLGRRIARLDQRLADMDRKIEEATARAEAAEHRVAEANARSREAEQKLTNTYMNYSQEGLMMGIAEADANWLYDLEELGIEAKNRIEAIDKLKERLAQKPTPSDERESGLQNTSPDLGPWFATVFCVPGTPAEEVEAALEWARRHNEAERLKYPGWMPPSEKDEV